MLNEIMDKIILNDSNKILLNDFWDINEEVFLNILKEAHEKNVPEKTRIKVMRERLIGDNEGHPVIGDQVLYYNYSTLKKFYKKFYGINYSPEVEEERQEEIIKAKEYLENCRIGARNGIFGIISKLEKGLIY